ncbi:MAG: response regulator transcription factor [Nitrospira sp.]|nr:response regulator transcription factor [Nitrospira sp.]
MHRSARSVAIEARNISMIRLLIVDSHEIARTGTRAVLNQTERIRVVGEAATIAAAVEAGRRLTPEVALVELRLPDGSGIDACRRIREASPGTRLLVLTHGADDESIVSALRAGATGFLLKTISGSDLARAIETVADGQAILDGAVAQRVMTHLCSLSVSNCGKIQPELSAQEKRVMDLVAQGKTNKEVAAALGLSDKTVKNYLSNVYEKLQVNRRAQATSSFIQQTRETCGLSIADFGCPALPPLT